jgi:hypothetical protein
VTDVIVLPASVEHLTTLRRDRGAFAMTVD